MQSQKIINRTGFLALLMIVFALTLFAQTESATKPSAKPLPNLILDTIDGKKWSLQANRGRIVLMNFWATWCEPCRTEKPMLVKIGKEYKPRGLEIVGVALDEDGAEVIKKFVAKYKINYPTLLPIPGSLLSQIEPVPTTLLIDTEGRLAKKYVGAMPEDILREDIEKLIKEFKPKGSARGRRKP
jgi:cytochrome c biogenesis protein CcmG, thiol:disulfide interchange protein DsbE